MAEKVAHHVVADAGAGMGGETLAWVANRHSTHCRLVPLEDIERGLRRSQSGEGRFNNAGERRSFFVLPLYSLPLVILTAQQTREDD